MKNFFINLINNRKAIYIVLTLILMFSVCFNLYLYLNKPIPESESLKNIKQLEILNELKNKELLSMLDSLTKTNTFLNFDLEKIKKENVELKKSLAELKAQYEIQTKEIDKLQKTNEKNKVAIPTNINNLWK